MIPDQIIPILQSLAEQLQTTIDHLWGVLVYQARIEAVTSIIQYLILLVLTVSAWLATRKTMRKIGDGECDELAYIPIAVGWVLLGTIWLVFFSELPDLVAQILNPEYWALKQILGGIKL